MTVEVCERIEKYADMCVVQKEEEGEESRGVVVVEVERVNWAAHLQNMGLD